MGLYPRCDVFLGLFGVSRASPAPAAASLPLGVVAERRPSSSALPPLPLEVPAPRGVSAKRGCHLHAFPFNRFRPNSGSHCFNPCCGKAVAPIP